MIENYLLEYLVQFAQKGTIREVAQAMNVTPASVSRGLGKLEQQLRIQLFDHQPQKLILTEVGKFAAKRADQLLKQQQAFIAEVQHYQNKSSQLSVGGTLPGPLLLLNQYYLPKNHKQLVIDMNVAAEQNLKKALLNHQYSLAFSSRTLKDPAIQSVFIGTEKLAIKVTDLNSLYERQSVSLDDLKGLIFISSAQIGEWKDVIEKNIPNTEFLYQTQTTALQELTQHTNFPVFRTNITHYLESFKNTDQKRRYIPINDSRVSLPIYALFLKNDAKVVIPVVAWLKNQFQKL